MAPKSLAPGQAGSGKPFSLQRRKPPWRRPGKAPFPGSGPFQKDSAAEA